MRVEVADRAAAGEAALDPAQRPQRRGDARPSHGARDPGHTFPGDGCVRARPARGAFPRRRSAARGSGGSRSCPQLPGQQDPLRGAPSGDVAEGDRRELVGELLQVAGGLRGLHALEHDVRPGGRARPAARASRANGVTPAWWSTKRIFTLLRRATALRRATRAARARRARPPARRRRDPAPDGRAGGSPLRRPEPARRRRPGGRRGSRRTASAPNEPTKPDERRITSVRASPTSPASDRCSAAGGENAPSTATNRSAVSGRRRGANWRRRSWRRANGSVAASVRTCRSTSPGSRETTSGVPSTAFTSSPSSRATTRASRSSYQWTASGRAATASRPRSSGIARSAQRRNGIQ